MKLHSGCPFSGVRLSENYANTRHIIVIATAKFGEFALPYKIAQPTHAGDEHTCVCAVSCALACPALPFRPFPLPRQRRLRRQRRCPCLVSRTRLRRRQRRCLASARAPSSLGTSSRCSRVPAMPTCTLASARRTHPRCTPRFWTTWGAFQGTWRWTSRQDLVRCPPAVPCC